MARDAIGKGSRDHWTTYPRRIDALTAAMDSAQNDDDYSFSGSCARIRTGMPRSFQRPCMPATEAAPHIARMLRSPELRDPRGYVLSADQPDFPTAIRFINALLENGIEVHRATAAFDAAGTRYPAG